jgi:hypothetical protein
MGDAYSYAFGGLDANTIQTLRNKAPISGTTPEAIQARIDNADTNNLLQSLDLSETNSTQTTNYATLLNRNQTLTDVANSVASNNNRIGGTAKDTYSRQAEISEWAAQNKMDTLFFFQTLFIYLCVFIALLFLRQYGILPNSAFWIFMTVLTIIIIGIFWNRASYTSAKRDKRYWNRRFIGLDDAGANLRSKLQCSLT